MQPDNEHPDRCPPAPWPFVSVRWHDSAADHHWCDEEDAPDTVEIITAGWRISNTKRGIKIAASYYRVGRKWMFGEVIAIPRKAILEELSCSVS